MNNPKFILGLDIGISSVGWAVIRDDGSNSRIEDFGVRIFESGEKNQGKNRKSQERRKYRSVRRLNRRRKHRRDRLLNYLHSINVLAITDLEEFIRRAGFNTYELRVRGLTHKLTAIELGYVLINLSNHRGYREFYDEDNSKHSEKGIIKTACSNLDEIYNTSQYRTIGEMLYEDKAFKDIENPTNKFPVVRNHRGNYRFLIKREYIEAEVEHVLIAQSKYYPQLTSQSIQDIKNIIFSQRDFEDGPGNPSDQSRRYKGYVDANGECPSIGQCPFYPEHKRGFRNTLVGDIFSLINILSQYSYLDISTGEIGISDVAARALIDNAIEFGFLTVGDMHSILNMHGFTVITKERATKTVKAFQFIPKIKTILEQSGLYWPRWIAEKQFDIETPSGLHRLGEILSKYHTPRRKRNELENSKLVNDSFIALSMSKSFNGTTGVSYRYMIEAIEAFRLGELYGDFQARKVKSFNELNIRTDKQIEVKKLPPITDRDISINPVVFRAINETRKVVNAIIAQYGNMSSINVEVASDLGRSHEQRLEIIKRQKANEKARQQLIAEYQELFPQEKISSDALQRYRLYKLQGGKCMYSGETIDLPRINTKMYEVDHIVPYSLILDNTINNKVLVLSRENQNKGQQVPLQYMRDKKQRDSFEKRIEEMLKNDKVSPKKYKYLCLRDLSDEETLNSWKSRNINDTRHITRYVVGYLQSSLNFQSKVKNNVHGIKALIVSRFRRKWLSNTIWGAEDKDRGNTHLHHSVDAVILANLTPAYVEVASDYLKLSGMIRRNNGKMSAECEDYLARCIRKMQTHYGFKPSYTDGLLRAQAKRGQIPTLIRNLRSEILVRFIDDPSLESDYRKGVMDFYGDNHFAERLRMPIVSYKLEKCYRGPVSADNPISVREIDGELYQINRKSASLVKRQDFSKGKIVSEDADLIKTLDSIFTGKSDKYSLGDYLNDNNLSEFKTLLGRRIHKISVREKLGRQEPGIKKIQPGNQTLLDIDKYYCLELYRDKANKLFVRGLRYFDLVKKNKKLYLNTPYPDNYGEHLMYLYTNEYIHVFNRQEQLKFAGNYRSIKNINSRRFNQHSNRPFQQDVTVFSIAQTDTIKKYDVDIMGRIRGEIKCGEPFSLVPGKK